MYALPPIVSEHVREKCKRRLADAAAHQNSFLQRMPRDVVDQLLPYYEAVQIDRMQEKRDHNDYYTLRLYRSLKHEIKTIIKEEHKWTGDDDKDDAIAQKRDALSTKLWGMVRCVPGCRLMVAPHDVQLRERGWCKRCKYIV